MTKPQDHSPNASDCTLSFIATTIIHAIIVAVFVFSSGSQETVVSSESLPTVFCRYIEDNRLFQINIPAKDWMDAEERVCGAAVKDVHFSGLLLEGAKLILDGDTHPVVIAQRESCSCSNEERVPILQDLSIVEAPRIGADTRKTALPRIINTPESKQQNVVTTQKTNATKKNDRKTQKSPSIEDLLNTATQFDDARPVSEDDPGGSKDGSRLSTSATGKGDPYLQKVKATLDNHMRAPASVPKAQLQKLKAKDWIKIGDNGIVWNWGFTQKSGNVAFDNMIEYTLKEFMVNGQKRFATPPEQWKLQMIPFTVDGREIR